MRELSEGVSMGVSEDVWEWERGSVELWRSCGLSNARLLRLLLMGRGRGKPVEIIMWRELE